MSTTMFHIAAAILLSACVFLYGLGTYYFSVMAREVYRQFPQSRWSWLVSWFSSHSTYLHRQYYPDSQLRKKCFICFIGMLACGFLGFFFWMK